MDRKINKESLLKSIYQFRILFPRSNIFYIVFFFFKFYGLILCTHNIKGLENKSKGITSVSSILSILLIFNSDFSLLNQCYAFICIIIFIMLLLLILGILIYYYLISKIYKSVQSKIQLKIKKLVKFYKKGFINYLKITLFYLILMILMFGQHILFYLSPGIILVFFKSDIESNSPNFSLDINSKYFDNYFQKSPIPISILAMVNLLSSIIIYIFFFIFIKLNDSRGIYSKYGKCLYHNNSIIIILFMTFLFIPCISISNIFDGNYKKNFRFILNICAVIICSFFILLHYKKLNSNKEIVTNFNLFIIILCWISGIIEIILYNIKKVNINQVFSTIRFILELLNSISLFLFINSKNLKYFEKYFTKNLFQQNKKDLSIGEIYIYMFYLEKFYENEKNSFSSIYILLNKHKENCSNPKCICNIFKFEDNKNLTLYQCINENQPIFFEFNFSQNSISKEQLCIIGEQEIANRIYQLYKKKNFQEMNTYCLYHVYYIYYFKKNLNLALYFAGKYFDSQIKFKFSTYYFLYEIKKQIIKEIYLKDNNNKLNDDELKIKEIKNIYNFIIVFLIIKQILFDSCVNLEKIFKFKKETNKNTKLNNLTHNSFLNFLKLCKKINKFNIKLEYLLSSFFLKNNKEPIDNKEISYLLSNYYLLLFRKIPPEVSNYFLNVYKYSLIENEIEFDFDKFYYKYPLIVALSESDNFNITYINSILCEFLSYTKKELIGKDFHLLLPSQIAEQHKFIVKQFLFLSNVDVKRNNSFILNKEKYIINCLYHSKLLPNFKSEFYIITNIDVIDDEYENKILYTLMLNHNFNFISVSKNFEEQFFFKIKMIETLKLNFCDFFGINSLEIKKRISHKYKKFKNTNSKNSYRNLKEQNNALSIFSNIPQEKMFLYYKPLNPLKYFKQIPIEHNDIIKKSQIYNAIIFLNKTLDEIGLDIDWYNRVKCFAERLKIPNININLNYLANLNNLHEINFYVSYTFKEIGSYPFFIVKLTEITNTNQLKKDTALIKKKLSFITTVIKERKSVLKLQIKKRNLGSILDTMNSQFNLNMNNSNSKTPLTKTGSIFQENSKNNLTSFDISSSLNANINEIQEKTHKNNNKNLSNGSKKIKNNKKNLKYNNEETELITGEKMEIMLEQLENSYHFLYILFYCLIFPLLILEIIVIYLRNNLSIKGTKFIINNVYFGLLKIDIYTNSLNALYFCDQITNDKNIKDLISKHLYDNVNSILIHYSNFMKSLEEINKYSEMNNFFVKLYEELDFINVEEDWELRTRKSSIIEEINIFQYSINTLLSSANNYDDYECRLKEIFFNENFLNLTLREAFYKREGVPSKEEEIFFYCLYNIIQKYKPKLEDLINEMIKIEINFINSFTYTFVIIINIIIIFLLISIMIVFIKMYLICKKEVKIILTHLYITDPYDVFFEQQILLFKEIIFEFSDCQIELYENLKKGKIEEPPPKRKISTKNVMINSNDINSFHVESPITNLSRKPLKMNKFQQIDLIQNNPIIPKNILSPKSLMIGTIFIILFIFLIILLLIINIISSIIFKENLILSIILCLNFMERLPRTIELMLYTHLSIIVGNSSIISGLDLNSYKGNNQKYLNYYHYDLDYERASQIESLSDSYYSNLFLENIVIKENIDKFMAKPLKTLSNIKDWQIKFNIKEYFCLYASLGDVIFEQENYDNILNFFKEVNNNVNLCYLANDKINEYGIETEYDYFYQEITNLYKDFYQMENNEDLKIEILNNQDKNRMIKNIEIPFRYVSDTFGHWFIIDLKNLMKSNSNLHKAYFTIIIILSLVMIIVIYLIQNVNYEMKVLLLFFLKLF